MEPQTIHKANIVQWIESFAHVVAVNRDHLTELDAAIGDGDHGVNMDRGFRAVAAKLSTVGDKDIAQILKTTGMTLVSTVGGASGPLYGTFFLQVAQSSAGKDELSLNDWIAMLEAALNGIIARGKAAVGDKTMLDTLAPALQALKDAAIRNATLAEALSQSAAAAQDGMQATLPLVARKGRASYLGERSASHIDPGAVSMYLLLKTAASTLAVA